MTIYQVTVLQGWVGIPRRAGGRVRRARRNAPARRVPPHLGMVPGREAAYVRSMPPSYLTRARSRARRRSVLEPSRSLWLKVLLLATLAVAAVSLVVAALAK